MIAPISFTSTLFLALLAVATLVIRLLPRWGRTAGLLLLSYAFYASWSLSALALLAAVSAYVYAVGLWIDKASTDRARDLALWIGQLGILCVLILFKYADALGSLLLAGSGFFAQIVAPLGISYYLFKSFAYLTDVYWGEYPAQRDPIVLALFIAFFPQIVSGPIQRPGAFFKQAAAPEFGRASWPQIDKAVGLLLLGFFEKLVLADRIGPLVEALDVKADAPALMALAADWGYLLQLFTDFSGVTHMALGIGLLFGCEGPPNFNRPFSATNIRDYWRRWHMSLTTWLGDYVFTPLRMMTRGLGSLGLSLSLMINMVLIGVWHGMNVTYLVFGIVHGLFLIGSALTLPARTEFFKRHPFGAPVRRVLATFITLQMVTFGMIFFRAPSMTFALSNIKRIVSFPSESTTWSAWSEIAPDVLMAGLVAAAVGFALGSGLLGLHKIGSILDRVRPSLQWGLYGACALLVVLLSVSTGTHFMYAKF